jgi:hypothetical protein
MRGVCESCGGVTLKDNALCCKCMPRHAAGTGSGWPTDRALRLANAARARWDRRAAVCWICGKLMMNRPRAEGRQPTCNSCTKKHGAGVCTECGAPMRISSKTSAPPDRRRCRDCQRSSPKAPPEPRVCVLCECEYVPKPMHRPGQQFCSKSCKTAWQNGARPPYERHSVVGLPRKRQNDRIRRQRRAETWDGVTNAEILERDRWRCGICGKVIGKKFKWPHPRSASIDHIVPISEGGEDTAGNKRAAHLACNGGRCNRGGGEQAALF